MSEGEYADAERFPINKEAPGLSFIGHGRGGNRVGGKFVIWEYVVENNQVKQLAIDFVHRAEGSGPPLFGMLRYHSSFE